MSMNQYIRFDWAAKYMLRNKADFAIFEGLISVLLGEKVTIGKRIQPGVQRRQVQPRGREGEISEATGLTIEQISQIED